VPVRSIEPHELGIEAAAAALWIGNDGVVDQPRAAVRAIAQSARDAGATLVTSAQVDAVVDEGDGLSLKIGERELRAEIVVYAGDHGLAALDAAFEDKLVPVREEALLAEGPGPRLPVRAGYGYSFFRTVGSDRVLAGGCRWAASSMGVGTVVTQPADARVQTRIEAQLRRHLPAARAILTRWAWIDTHTCDGLPIIGPLPGSARRIACTGFCGNDWGLATAAAAAITEGLLGRGQPDIPSILAFSRFV
jgi:glycine/D-amino acid oxidase-like deaminating enzyme